MDTILYIRHFKSNTSLLDPVSRYWGSSRATSIALPNLLEASSPQGRSKAQIVVFMVKSYVSDSIQDLVCLYKPNPLFSSSMPASQPAAAQAVQHLLLRSNSAFKCNNQPFCRSSGRCQQKATEDMTGPALLLLCGWTRLLWAVQHAGETWHNDDQMKKSKAPHGEAAAAAAAYRHVEESTGSTILHTS